MRDAISNNESLLILGSLNAKKEDRSLPRRALRPMQALFDGRIIPISHFDDWGELGISAMAWQDGDPNTLYLTTGAELIRLNLEERKWTDLELDLLSDVHEMTCSEDKLWLANTGRDEVVVYDIDHATITERIKLSLYEDEDMTNGTDVVRTFHCNQVFAGYDGHRYILVHHISGRQVKKRFRNRIVKSQGDGGVINMTTGERIPLGLKAPHSVRRLQDQYWLLDSGHSTVNIYDTRWNLLAILKTYGWGRGADFSTENNSFYVGISAKRKRYLDLIPGQKQNANMVQFFDTRTLEPKDRVIVSHVEQVNNLYLMDKTQFLKLMDFA